MRYLYVMTLLLWGMTSPATCAEWAEFRGPTGQGFVSSEQLPLTWSETDHVTWKTEIPGKGWSSPVARDARIWLTTAISETPTEAQIARQLQESGLDEKQFKQLQVSGALSLQAICLDQATGQKLHEIELFRVEAPEAIHSTNSYASPTPVLEADRVYCHFGTNGTACLDSETGEVHWKRQIPLQFSVGAGSSPVVYHDVLVLVCDGIDEQFILGLNKHTGETLWKTPRPPIRNTDGQHRKAFSTPLLVSEGGRDQLVICGAQWVVSYDPQTGEERWRVDHGEGFSNVPRPVYGHGMVYICTGFGKPQLWAIRVDGAGDVSQSHVAWRATGQISAKPSPVLVGDLLFVIGDTGVASCFDAHTGKEVWKRRIGGNYTSSPIATRDRVYLFSEEGETTVLRAAPEYIELAKGHVEGKLMASPAVLGSTIFLRSDTKLYRIE